MAARSRRKGTEVSDAIYSSMVKVIPNSRVNPPADFVCCACSEAGPGILVRCSYCENDGKQRCRKEIHLHCAQENDLISLKPGTCQLFVRCPAHEDPVLFCECKQKYQANRGMLSCDNCQDWFHFDCMGKDEKKYDHDSEFLCKSCLSLKRNGVTISPDFVKNNLEKDGKSNEQSWGGKVAYGIQLVLATSNNVIQRLQTNEEDDVLPSITYDDLTHATNSLEYYMNLVKEEDEEYEQQKSSSGSISNDASGLLGTRIQIETWYQDITNATASIQHWSNQVKDIGHSICNFLIEVITSESFDGRFKRKSLLELESYIKKMNDLHSRSSELLCSPPTLESFEIFVELMQWLQTVNLLFDSDEEDAADDVFKEFKTAVKRGKNLLDCLKSTEDSDYESLLDVMQIYYNQLCNIEKESKSFLEQATKFTKSQINYPKFELEKVVAEGEALHFLPKELSNLRKLLEETEELEKSVETLMRAKKYDSEMFKTRELCLNKMNDSFVDISCRDQFESLNHYLIHYESCLDILQSERIEYTIVNSIRNEYKDLKSFSKDKKLQNVNLYQYVKSQLTTHWKSLFPVSSKAETKLKETAMAILSSNDDDGYDIEKLWVELRSQKIISKEEMALDFMKNAAKMKHDIENMACIEGHNEIEHVYAFFEEFEKSHTACRQHVIPFYSSKIKYEEVDQVLKVFSSDVLQSQDNWKRVEKLIENAELGNACDRELLQEAISDANSTKYTNKTAITSVDALLEKADILERSIITLLEAEKFDNENYELIVNLLNDAKLVPIRRQVRHDLQRRSSILKLTFDAARATESFGDNVYDESILTSLKDTLLSNMNFIESTLIAENLSPFESNSISKLKLSLQPKLWRIKCRLALVLKNSLEILQDLKNECDISNAEITSSVEYISLNKIIEEISNFLDETKSLTDAIDGLHKECSVYVSTLANMDRKVWTKEMSSGSESRFDISFKGQSIWNEKKSSLKSKCDLLLQQMSHVRNLLPPHIVATLEDSKAILDITDTVFYTVDLIAKHFNKCSQKLEAAPDYQAVVLLHDSVKSSIRKFPNFLLLIEYYECLNQYVDEANNWTEKVQKIFPSRTMRKKMMNVDKASSFEDAKILYSSPIAVAINMSHHRDLKEVVLSGSRLIIDFESLVKKSTSDDGTDLKSVDDKMDALVEMISTLRAMTVKVNALPVKLYKLSAAMGWVLNIAECLEAITSGFAGLQPSSRLQLSQSRNLYNQISDAFESKEEHSSSALDYLCSLNILEMVEGGILGYNFSSEANEALLLFGNIYAQLVKEIDAARLMETKFEEYLFEDLSNQQLQGLATLFEGSMQAIIVPDAILQRRIEMKLGIRPQSNKGYVLRDDDFDDADIEGEWNEEDDYQMVESDRTESNERNKQVKRKRTVMPSIKRVSKAMPLCAREGCNKIRLTSSIYCSGNCIMLSTPTLFTSLESIKSRHVNSWFKLSSSKETAVPSADFDAMKEPLMKPLELEHKFIAGMKVMGLDINEINGEPNERKVNTLDHWASCLPLAAKKALLLEGENSTEMRHIVIDKLTDIFSLSFGRLKVTNAVVRGSLLAADIEEDLYMKYSKCTTQESIQSYKKHYAMLARNLKEKHNDYLIFKLESHQVSLTNLLKMTSQQLADPAIQSQRSKLKDIQANASQSEEIFEAKRRAQAEQAEAERVNNSLPIKTIKLGIPEKVMPDLVSVESPIVLPLKEPKEVEIRNGQISSPTSTHKTPIDGTKKAVSTGGTKSKIFKFLKANEDKITDSTLLQSKPVKQQAVVEKDEEPPASFYDGDNTISMEDDSGVNMELEEKEPKDICIPEDTNDEEMIMITVPPKRNMKVYNSSGSFDVVISKSGGIKMRTMGLSTNRQIHGLMMENLVIEGRTKLDGLQKFIEDSQKKGKKVIIPFRFVISIDTYDSFRKFSDEFTAAERSGMCNVNERIQLYLVPPLLRDRIPMLANLKVVDGLEDDRALYAVLVLKQNLSHTEYADRDPVIYIPQNESSFVCNTDSLKKEKVIKSALYTSQINKVKAPSRPQAKAPVRLTQSKAFQRSSDTKIDHALILKTAEFCNDKGQEKTMEKIQRLKDKPNSVQNLPFLFEGEVGHEEFKTALRKLNQMIGDTNNGRESRKRDVDNEKTSSNKRARK